MFTALLGLRPHLSTTWKSGFPFWPERPESTRERKTSWVCQKHPRKFHEIFTKFTILYLFILDYIILIAAFNGGNQFGRVSCTSLDTPKLGTKDPVYDSDSWAPPMQWQGPGHCSASDTQTHTRTHTQRVLMCIVSTLHKRLNFYTYNTARCHHLSSLR